MSVNYDALMLGSNIQLTDKVTIYVPTIEELVNRRDDGFSLYQRVFAISVRELFSGMPEEVDKIEESYPTFWEMAFDKDMGEQVGSNMFQEGASLLELIIRGLSYWTHIPLEDFQILVQSKKIVSEKYNWVVDRSVFDEFCEYVRFLTLYRPNEDLIAPKGISSKPHQCKVWAALYKGRVYKLKRQPTATLGDKILILETESSGFIPFTEIRKMTYYQFMNLYSSYETKEANEREFAMFISSKFDIKDFKLKDWRDSVSLIKRKITL